jgi:hypothetical protein
MTDKLVTIKEVSLNNNCPECYSNTGLQLTFKQKFVETKFYRSTSKDVVHEIDCKTCNTIIYPVNWTEDIERVFVYHQKAFTPKKTSLNPKRLSWILISLISIMIITALTLLL